MIEKLLIANRGEIALRIARSAAELGVAAVSIYSEDDADCLHVKLADEVSALRGAGAAAYLDIEQIVRIAREHGCTAVHPGYGFLSENASFAANCTEAGLIFVGPDAGQLRLLGDKSEARQLARRCAIPVLAGTNGSTSLNDARAFVTGLKGGAVMLKAMAGGGGRGIRLVDAGEDLAAAFDRCSSEAERSFGLGALYVEQFLPRARHVEVQIVGDGTGAITHLWDRECSLQRNNQKVIEIAPAVGLPPALRQSILDAAVTIARSIGYRGIGTFEFLVDASSPAPEAFYFLEANPRLQVEHTVTEEILGVDLVALQLGIAAGRNLESLGMTQAEIPAPAGIAVQARINMETMQRDGSVKPASGTLAVYEPPSGPGVRVDGIGYSGYRSNPRFDSLLCKTIVHVRSQKLGDAMRKVARTLGEFRIEGVATNLRFLSRLVEMPALGDGAFHTRFIEEHCVALAAEPYADRNDPLAILRMANPGQSAATAPDRPVPDGMIAIRAPLQGTVIAHAVEAGDFVSAGRPLLIMDAMKMEHVVSAPAAGIVSEIRAEPGDTVAEATVLAVIEPGDGEHAADSEQADIDLDHIRSDLAELYQRRELLGDAARAGATERRHANGLRTARENIDDLCDPGSFMELGGFAVAARRQRNSLDELIRTTPADGFIMGTARVNGDRFSDDRSRCAVMSYDPSVMAGTQGMKGHEKLDRMLEVAEKARLPVVFFTEGGGGRPGDSDKPGVGYNFIRTFSLLGKLSGLVPVVGVNNGRCFGGNAFILGCCDVVVATRSSTIGIGGPAVIEGAGLGSYRPEDVGPASMQEPNGVIDVLVDDEIQAVAAVKKYLSYFQGAVTDWSCADQRPLRSVIPQNRRRVYDMRKLVNILADTDSVLELRQRFGPGIITALSRIEGRPVAIMANNPHYLGGAIDAPAADKAARFMQLCEAFDLPLLSLIDTPGNMVGPEAEKAALIRHCARMVVIGSNVTVPWIAVVIRKGYGLGGLAMAGGSFSNCIATLSWPTGEFGGMPMEGFVKLGFRDQLAAIADVDERKAKFEQMVAEMYENGKALNAATFFEFDDVIDPIETRRRVVEALRAAPAPGERHEKKLRWLDTW